MRRDELLAEITRAFQDVPHPGEAALLPAGTASEAAHSIQAAFSARSWPDLPDEVLRASLTSLALLSPVGFRYYLPAFLHFALREPMPHGAELLLTLLKLPAELPNPVVAELLSYFEAASPPVAAISSLMQQQTSQTNQALNLFIRRVGQLTFPQAKAIYHFLTYLQEEGPAARQREPAVAIERYWFQFA